MILSPNLRVGARDIVESVVLIHFGGNFEKGKERGSIIATV